MRTDYNKLIPAGVIFNLKEIEDLKIIKTPQMKKLIQKGEIETTKVGVKLHVSRSELIRYLESNTMFLEQPADECDCAISNEDSH